MKNKNKFEEVKMRETDKRNMIMSLKDEANTMVKNLDKEKQKENHKD